MTFIVTTKGVYEYMAAPKRTAQQRQADLVATSELYVKGHSQAEIAGRFGVPREQIAYDLREIRQNWIDTQVSSFDGIQARELEKLDRLERSAWHGWELSLTAQEGQSVGRTIRDGGGEGDPRFLEIVTKCIERRARLLGLNAPTNVPLPRPTAKVDGRNHGSQCA